MRNLIHTWIQFLDKHRFEFLLVALSLLLFDKVFFPDNDIYLQIVWPINMLILSISSIGLFRDKVGQHSNRVKNFMGIVSIIIPFAFQSFSENRVFLTFVMIFFIIYYSLLFVETLTQIIQKTETDLSVLFGSISGYLLLILIAAFNFMLIEFVIPFSFDGVHHDNIGHLYNDITYYSFTLISSTGFGDILPVNNSSRLASSLFSTIGQFYLVALVGILVSRFNTNK